MRKRSYASMIPFCCLLPLLAGCPDDNNTSPIKDMSTVVDMSVDQQPDLVADMPEMDQGDISMEMSPPMLVANAGENITGLVGQTITLDGSASIDAVSFQWDFGNGQRWDMPKDQATAMVTYDQPGRYKAVLTVTDRNGKTRSDATVVTITKPATHQANDSAAMQLRYRDGQPTQLGVLSEDGATLSLIERTEEAQPFKLNTRKQVCAAPKHLAAIDNGWAITCPRTDQVMLVTDDDQTSTITLPYGSRPHGIVFHQNKLYVTLQGSGKLVSIDLQTKNIEQTIDAIADARGLCVLPDGRLLITRWRSPDEQGKMVVIDLNDPNTPTTWTLPFDPRNASDTEHGGVPNYLESAIVDPTGEQLVVPSLQANIKHGLVFNQKPFAHDISVRAVLSFVDVATGQSKYETRYHFDSRGLASTAVFSPNGADLYVAMRGSRLVERLDMLRLGESGTIFNVGFAPQSLRMSRDGRYLFVEASLSRHVQVYDVLKSAQPELVTTISLVDQEPLSAQVLLGKQLFNDSFDLRITQEGYIACAHCHLDGESDWLTWDFTDRGEGLRNTTSLLGRQGDGHGPIHWSGNFDEIQDFEHDIREHFKGSGFLDDTFYDMNSPLGEPKAGKSTELDALAAYLTSLDWYHRSPHRLADGQLSDAAKRGKLLFEDAQTQCTTCHTGQHLTDSTFITPGQPLLHDVGTLKSTSGKRLNGPLTGIDTPTLHSLYNSPPYLHDGSATTIRATIGNDTHGKTAQLTPAQLDDLVAYLLSLDGKTQ